jgi:hypothetical protein
MTQPLKKNELPHLRTVICHDCHGTGWICVTCGKPGDECRCSDDDQEAFDCQTCEGDGFNEVDDDER